MHDISLRMCMVGPHARAHGLAIQPGKYMRVHVATNRTGILLANMRPGQLKMTNIVLHSTESLRLD